MNIGEVTEMGREIALLTQQYVGGPQREMRIDPALYGYFLGRGIPVQRQFHAYLPGAQRPPRVDFRLGGTNPTLLEFAVRPAGGGGQLYGSQNRSELLKLCRIPSTKARLRVLLLIDLYRHALSIDCLKPTFDRIDAGRGNFARHSVRVVYAHPEIAFNFGWSPFKTC